MRPAQRTSVTVTADGLQEEAERLLGQGLRLALMAAHDDGPGLRVVYLFAGGPPDRRVELVLPVDLDRPEIPSLASVSFPASRFEREIRDLFGIEPVGHPQPRRLVLHQHWPAHWFPMRRGAGEPPPFPDEGGSYPFAPVAGEGVYEIPVGPVHAGLIEPGHFRFWAVGETILRMKARLWFVHKGIERLFEGRDVEEGLVLAERISGDSAVSHGLAFCLAVEEAEGRTVGEGSRLLRGVLLELERLYNHVADIGALCNDVGFSLAQARALDLRESLLRLNAGVTGHRLLRGGVRPGGAGVLRLPTAAELAGLEERFEALVELATSNSMVVERFTGTATLTTAHALELGVVGVAARASGVAVDARQSHPVVDGATEMPVAVRSGGDVLARFEIRVEEARTSFGLIGDFCAGVGPLAGTAPATAPAGGSGVGIVEGWRGPAVHRVELDAAGRLARVKVVDPSFMNWPSLPVALADTIVPDFPLANKSFNLSYAGNDL